MKIVFLFLFLFFLTPRAEAWWTQRKASEIIFATDLHLQNRLRLSIRKIHLYQNQNGKQTFIQSGSALIIDQKHLITSYFNVSRLGKYSNYFLYVEQNNQLIPCQVKYLDTFNEVALLYSSSTLSNIPNLSDFDFSYQLQSESLSVLSLPSEEIKTSEFQILDDGLRELFQIKTTPQAHFSRAGLPVLNSKSKIVGLYLGKIQGGNLEYIIPTAKLSHLFEKAKLTTNLPPDFAAPQRQFQSQIKVFQEMFQQSLLTETGHGEILKLQEWKISDLPKSLACSNFESKNTTGLKCQAKIPFMQDSYSEAYHFEFNFIPILTNNIKDLTTKVEELSEAAQKSFLTEPDCRQFRILIHHIDTQLHICTLANQQDPTHNTYLRAVYLPKKGNPLFVSMHLRGFSPEQTKVLMKPFFQKVERYSNE